MKSMIMTLLGSMLILTSVNAKSATDIKPTTSLLHAVPVTDAAGLLVNGTLDVSQFISQNGRLWAICKLKGIVGGIGVDDDCVVPITVGDCSGGPIRLNNSNGEAVTLNDCDCLTISFGECTVDNRLSGQLTGLLLDLNPCQVQCTTQDYSSDLLCTINNRIRTVECPIEEIASSMNQLL